MCMYAGVLVANFAADTSNVRHAQIIIQISIAVTDVATISSRVKIIYVSKSAVTAILTIF